MNNTKFKPTSTEHFDSILIRMASPERILDWSHGEVQKPETINYRTQRSERGGLFDEKIFGPEKDYECYCGKYRGIRYKGIVCEKCGVEITRSVVRRERMGHIDLACPVSHVWYLKSIPSRMALLLGITSSDLEKVVYFAGHIITEVDENQRKQILKDIDSEYKTKLKALQDEKSKEKLKDISQKAKKEVESIQRGIVLDDSEFHAYSVKYGNLFEANIGAEAIYEIFTKLDIEQLENELEERYENASVAEKTKLQKRLSLVKGLRRANLRPEWMFLNRIPVIPPQLRPMVALDGGRHATSDINDLYRRVINRNNRLKKLMEIGAPDVILRNEKRILQEAVDALVDNTIRRGTGYTALNQAQRRPLKSLSSNLKGKQGILRSNLLGKRVDYSARSVIVIGPTLALDQCGLPKHMALELFRPFVISELLKRELAYNIRGAGRLIDDGVEEVWAILEEVIKDKYVLLNRAPTLHRLGVQAFRPILIEGNAIQVHPMVCSAFNADFDGDQMAVHLPLSEEAQYEAREIMASNKNLLKPGDGAPHVTADKDIILGCFWMTQEIEGSKGEGKIFSSPNDAINAYDYGLIDFRAKVTVLGTDSEKYADFEGKPFDTTVGRLLFNSVLPSNYRFINSSVERKIMSRIVNDIIENYETEEVSNILDKIKNLGFKYATISGTTWGIDDVTEPEGKNEFIKASQAKASNIYDQFNEGLLSDEERHRKVTEIWYDLRAQIEKIVPKSISTTDSVHDMMNSGARGSISQITNIVGLKGLIAGTSGQTIEFPVLSSSKEGLTPTEYFITTHGSRKGMSDTALNTAKAGYLTRRLFVVAQDVVIKEEECGTKKGVTIRHEADELGTPISKLIKGRFLAETVKDPKGNVLYKRNDFLNSQDAKKVEEAGVTEVSVRSPMSCESNRGVCQKCYGLDLGKNEVIEVGEAIGTVAAQAIGEPGTQLTMRTFHKGGTASAGGDITQGLPRVEEIFERRNPKNPAVIAKVDGVISEVVDTGKEKFIKILPEIEDKKKNKKKTETEYTVHYLRTIVVREGDKVKKGDILTDGSVNLQEYYKYAGVEKVQDYIINEISRIYELQAASISRKHIEVIIRQMFSRIKITDPGTTHLTIGDIVEQSELEKINDEALSKDGEKASGTPLILGITEVSLTRESFLSAASFQNTTRVLINAAIQGKEDHLNGLMENVIIGKLIPAGTGYEGSPKSKAALEYSRKEETESENAEVAERKTEEVK
ncbi:MAG: DNA-directed RNA polymerase subunit beta' [Candidatus Campbellbacteria bacterium]|nr:DNA-directed RNA polymerase subunit beta' [Candidatus Campbellbacteria bacterium]